MAEREADRVRPDLLCEQAVKALVSVARREISQYFVRSLKDYEAVPSLFGANELSAKARTRFESEIASSIEGGQGVDVAGAIRDAFCRFGERCAQEQLCQLVADRHPFATAASESVRRAFGEAAQVAADRFLTRRAVAKSDNRVQLSEDLLGRPVREAGL